MDCHTKRIAIHGSKKLIYHICPCATMIGRCHIISYKSLGTRLDAHVLYENSYSASNFCVELLVPRKDNKVGEAFTPPP